MEQQTEVSQKANSNDKGTKRILIYAILLAVLIVVGLLAIFTFSNNSATTKTEISYDNIQVPQSVLLKLNTPNSLNNQIGIGTASYSGLIPIKNTTILMLNGKPEILYLGADYCPYCAAMRWAFVIALSRFGNFSNLHYMTSSASDYSPSTPTFTFYNSTYTSNYISFVGVEQTTNQPSGNSYKPLQTPTPAEEALQSQYDGQGSIPFILFANTSALIGATYDPLTVLDTLNWSTVISDIYNSSTIQSQSIIGSANLITTKICEADNNTPSNVCSQQYVKNIERLS